ncbi:uncharacterized protein [Amphiura filiformis]|uniref:uncharacterized protein isoform X2 n=1 Tax=Amphiura filiformis TaxID=82378 RepID=UPI003B224457
MVMTNSQKVSFLASLGGRNLEQATRNVMANVFTKTIALQYSLCGRRQKKCFETLVTYQLVIRAFRKIIPSSRDEIRKVIGSWLACAGDREGGRKERRNQRNEDKTGDSSDGE